MGGLLAIFLKKSLSVFLMRRLIIVLIQGCMSLYFAVLCGMYLDIAISISEVMFSLSRFTGVNISKFRIYCTLCKG